MAVGVLYHAVTPVWTVYMGFCAMRSRGRRQATPLTRGFPAAKLCPGQRSSGAALTDQNPGNYREPMRESH
jgi:hypothetical protein